LSENLAQNQKIADIVQNIADKYKCTPAQLALAWLFQKAENMGVSVFPIPGSTKIHNALGNLEATKVKITDDDDMKTLESLADQVAGARGPEWYMQRAIESQK
jgi:aryl-alcohol dehydrogenase-like predicted oxidoreductase